MKRWWLSLLLLFLAVGLRAAATTPDPLLTDLRQVFGTHLTAFYPDEQPTVVLDGNTLTVQYHVRPYQVYSINMTGEISTELHTEQGPAADGVLMQLAVNPGPYKGQAMVPQVLDRPYWCTYLQAYALPDRDAHLWMALSYGSRTNADVVAFLESCTADFTKPQTLPTDQAALRGQLLKQADIDLRAGLLKLAEQYPALATTNDGPLTDTLKAQPSPDGQIALFFGHSPDLKGQETLEPVPAEQQYSIMVYLTQHAPADKWRPQPQIGIFSLYPHLLLGGQVSITATDPKLDAALIDLVDRTLSPLAQYEAELAKAGNNEVVNLPE